MRSYVRVLSGLLVATMAVLTGCANDENPGPVHARNLGTQKGEVLVPYEPVVSRKITQDPSQFPMPAAPPPVEAPAAAPAEAAAASGEAPGAGDEYVTLAKQVVQNLAAGQYGKVAAAFDANMKANLSEAQLQSAWDQRVAQVGLLQEMGAVRRAQTEGMEVAIVSCRMEKGGVDVQVVFNARKEIAGLFVMPAGAPLGGEPAAPAAPETPAPAAAEPSARGGQSGPSGLEQLPPTAPAPVGLGN